MYRTEDAIYHLAFIRSLFFFSFSLFFSVKIVHTRINEILFFFIRSFFRIFYLIILLVSMPFSALCCFFIQFLVRLESVQLFSAIIIRCLFQCVYMSMYCLDVNCEGSMRCALYFSVTRFM